MARSSAAATRAEARGDEDVSRAIISLFMAEPFFAHVVQGLRRRVDTATPTAAVAQVGAHIELRVNPVFLATLKKDERVAVMKHEVLHVILKHLLRASGKHPLLWNLACDVVVNELIGNWTLPAGAITRATFPDLPIPADATAEAIYRLLSDLARDKELAHKCPLSAKALEDLASQGEDDRHGDPRRVGGHSDHAGWGRVEREDGSEGYAGDGQGQVCEADATLTAAAEAALDGLLVKAADRGGPRIWGSLPGTVRDAIRSAQERATPRIDWRRTLRIFAGSSGRTRLVATTRRESSRYGQTGMPHEVTDPRAPREGRLVPGTKIKRLRTLLVAIDTSGSIGAKVLEAFFREIHAIWKSGATLLLVFCDAAVQGTMVYRGSAPSQVGGGGGTAFEPVFRWMREEPGRRFDGVIYLTDGIGPAPETRPPCKLLWVVTHERGLGEHLRFGAQVRLDLST
jgi:predicted metal-dependent peptidase